MDCGLAALIAILVQSNCVQPNNCTVILKHNRLEFNVHLASMSKPYTSDSTIFKTTAIPNEQFTEKQY